MSTCEKYQQLIGAYHDGELTERQTQCLFDHLEKCDACRTQMAEEKMISSLFRDRYESIDLPESDIWLDRGLQAVRRGAMIRVTTRWAAAAACVIIGCSVFLTIAVTSDTRSIPDNWERMALVQDEGVPKDTFEHPSGEIELAMLLIANNHNQEDAGND